ncbi:MAG TPA: hypothetical protein VIM00_03105 [Candidatus Acidoferrum sp.]
METTSVEASAAETTSMTSAAKAAAAARECFVVRGHQSPDDKRATSAVVILEAIMLSPFPFVVAARTRNSCLDEKT